MPRTAGRAAAIVRAQLAAAACAAVALACALTAGPAGAVLPGKDGGLIYMESSHDREPSYNVLRHERWGEIGGGGAGLPGNDPRGVVSGSTDGGASPDGEWVIVPLDTPDGSSPTIMHPDGTGKRKLRFKRPDGTFLTTSGSGAYQFTSSNQIAYAELNSYGLVLADIDGNVISMDNGLATARASVGGSQSDTSDYAIASDGTVYFPRDHGSEIKIYQWKPGTTTATLLATRPDPPFPYSVLVTDVAPDDRAVLFYDREGIHEIDVATKQVRTIVPVDPASMRVEGAKYSPDGALVAYREIPIPSQFTNPIRIVSRASGGASRSIARSGEQSTPLMWVPDGGALEATITGDQLVGDLVELDVTVANNTREPLTEVDYDHGEGTPGIVYNTAPYSDFNRALFTPAGGPAPGLATAFATGQSVENQYLLGLDAPGFVMARVKVGGTRPNGARAIGEGRAEIFAANRDLEPWEQAMQFTGAWAYVEDQLRREAQASYDRMHESIVDAIKKTTPSSGKAAAKNTLLERQLAHRFAGSEKALSWLPAKTPEMVKAVVAYSTQRAATQKRVAQRKFGSYWNKAVEIPWDYWTGQSDDPYASASLGTALYAEGEHWKGKASSFAADGVALLSDPARQHEFKQKVDQTVTQLGGLAREKIKAAPGQAKKFALLLKDDPVRAAQYIADVKTTAETELKFAVAEAVIAPGKQAVANGVKNVGTRLMKFAKAGDFVEDAGRSVPALRAVNNAVDLPSASRLGMPEADQGILQEIVTKLEAKAKLHGHDLKLALSFRPSNPHSVGIKDGVGKVLFAKAKTGVELDLLLGMHPDGLGKLAIYKPKLPKGYALLPPKLRREIDERVADMNKAYKDWNDPKSDLGRAQRKKGATFENKIGSEDQIATTTVNMKLSGKKSGDTIVVRYDHLNVDGRQIVKKGDPKWVVSDYDGNGILTADQKNLPASIRGMIELEANVLIAQAGQKGLRTGFHGFTHNGFDLKGKDYRYVFKYLVEGMTPAQKKQALETYLAKYAVDGKADPIYQKLLSGDLGGDFVIRVTSQGTGVGQGVRRRQAYALP